jgi:membrane protein YqaA with SNARE-associated domain
MLDRILSVRNRSWEWFKQRADGPHAVFWLALLAFLEPTFSPIVPETLMVAMVLAQPNRWLYFSVVATAASIAGGIFGYVLGAALFQGVGDIVIAFYGLESWVARVHALFSQNVLGTMAFVTSTPVPDKIFVFLAGFLHINFILYLLGYVIGRSARIFAVGWIVKKFGPRALALADKYARIVAAVFLAVCVVLLLDVFDVISIRGLLH